MMAVETFVFLYIIGFAVSVVLALSLLVAAARYISKNGSRSIPYKTVRNPSGGSLPNRSDARN